jgi:membrane protein implicated in regulation of membrane protease activity
MEKPYIFFYQAAPLLILMLGILILFSGIALIALLLPGKHWAVALFITATTLLTVKIAYRFEKRNSQTKL